MSGDHETADTKGECLDVINRIVIPCHRVTASYGSLGGDCGMTSLELKGGLPHHQGAQL